MQNKYTTEGIPHRKGKKSNDKFLLVAKKLIFRFLITVRENSGFHNLRPRTVVRCYRDADMNDACGIESENVSLYLNNTFYCQ
mmetsp:Transcript_9256/g.21959  ORF Transcript_9256/g.21959 Transcript_9256/m.21959 type:complete len:83 (-) Transcript_9256:2305-2553(-)